MKRLKRITAAFLAVLCVAMTWGVSASAEGFDYGWDTDKDNNPTGPNCKAYLMLNLDTDTVVYSDNADEQLPMASLTKIMTYIVAYENIPDIENTEITIPQSVFDELSGTGSSMADFDVGDTFTGEQMLYLMMVPSGNNAALTLAKYVDQLYASGKIGQEDTSASSGTEDSSSTDSSTDSSTTDDPEAVSQNTDTSSSSESSTSSTTDSSQSSGEFDPTDYTGTSYFVQLMNEKAAELGCTNTHFTNPHGLNNPNHYSTARDMVTITKYAMSLPLFTEITSSTAYNYYPVGHPEKEKTANTTNRLLTNYAYSDGTSYYYRYATGIKTGSHDQAGYCIVASATYEGYTYVVACLGCPSVDSEGNSTGFHGEMLDAATLFRWAFLNLEIRTVAAQGDILGDVPLKYAWKQDTLQLVAGENVSVMLPKNVDVSSIIVETDVPENVEAPVERGEQVGTATMSYAGEVIATVPLVAAESVSRSEMLSFISQGGSVLTSPWFLIIMGVILALILIYVLLILLYRRKQKQLRRVRKYRDL